MDKILEMREEYVHYLHCDEVYLGSVVMASMYLHSILPSVYFTYVNLLHA